jgi:hypothetical protein
MKTIISIPLIILILFTGISVKFAAHYCGGALFATKVSLTGEPATCGMESESQKKTGQENFTSHCCDDVISTYSINNNYIPSEYDVKVSVKEGFNNINALVDFFKNQETIINTPFINIRPPGTNQPNSVDRPVLCIFRI